MGPRRLRNPARYPDHPQRMDGSPRPPKPKPSTAEEEAFLRLGPGPESRLIEAFAKEVSRIAASPSGADAAYEQCPAAPVRPPVHRHTGEPNGFQVRYQLVVEARTDTTALWQHRALVHPEDKPTTRP